METAKNLAQGALRMAKDTLISADQGSALETCNLQLKATPRKDARSASQLAIQSNNMMKRNEQGVWQKRFVCLVPHLFLYYYDSDQSEAPRGVIDLEYFTGRRIFSFSARLTAHQSFSLRTIRLTLPPNTCALRLSDGRGERVDAISV